MPPRLSRPLLAFALAASTLACAAAAPLVSQTAPAAVAPAIPAAPLERLDPGPRPYPPTRAEPKPTLGDRAAAIALRAIGTPYRWGGSSPASGFDCSGLVQWAYAQAGISIPRVTHEQILADNATKVGRNHLLPGDLVFFRDSTGYVHHVGISLGGDRFLHSPHTGDVVKISSLSGWYADTWVGGRRL